MRTTGSNREREADVAAPRTAAPAALGTVPRQQPGGGVGLVVLTPTTSLQPAARTPAAIIGLGTQALATALVVRSCPPGYLRTALDALDTHAETDRR